MLLHNEIIKNMKLFLTFFFIKFSVVKVSSLLNRCIKKNVLHISKMQLCKTTYH